MSESPKHVLIVDDDSRNRKLAADLLRLAGYRVSEAATAREALALTGELQPDAVLMDLRLPDLDGVHAARILRAEPGTAGVPIIALTAVALDGDEEWLEPAGFAGYIPKPIDIERFATMVRDLIPTVAGEAPPPAADA